MHNLAIALSGKGYTVTGSDDEIFDPARTHLQNLGLLPAEMGWFPSKIDKSIDTIILGMHAREDNPELIRARELGIDIKSFPEYLYEQTRDKTRIVIGGSHGKTTITSMVMHVFRHCGVIFDYMVGSKIDGFETMVGLFPDSEIAVFEGDEYLTSVLDRRPKFHLYNPDIAVINGIAWDHVNVFPDYDGYVEQFRIFADKITPKGQLIYFREDPEVALIAQSARSDIRRTPYSVHGYFQNAKGFFAANEKLVVPLMIFGEHNMQNLAAARAVCLAAALSEEQFYEAIKSFSGSARRLQLIREEGNSSVYLDFAHSPSKVKGTVEAVSERYPLKKLVACFELHTFSSLSSSFLEQYRGSMDAASVPLIYFNPHALKLKRLPIIGVGDVASAFGIDESQVYNDSSALIKRLEDEKGENRVFLLMSSGDFNGTDIISLSDELLK